MAAPKKPITRRVLHLRSPDSGVVGQGVRFLLAGGTVALIYLTTTTVLHELFDVPFQLALLIGTVAGLAAHFTLQRLFVWVHHEEFALGLHEQVGRYLLVAAVQYGLTALSTSVLPDALDLPVTPVYLATALTLTSVNFLVFRGKIFHAGA
jgi:putative flippase GtrA